MTLQALTIIDLSTHFMEIVALKNKESITIAGSLDQVWLCHYPRPVDCLHDNGTEFVSAEFQELLQSYGIQSKLTTVKNPQANGILEFTHQVIGNLLHSSRLIAQDLDTISAQQELLMPVMWAINTTFHTTLKASPAQLAFSRDMILPTSFAANWYAINNCKQAQSAEFQELLQSYGIRSKLTTVKNPQANSILKRTHQVIGNLLRSNRFIAQDLNTVSAQQELLMPVMWAINTTFHTTLKASPAQLAFSRDMILPTSFATNWYAINNCKQAQSQSAADAENHKCILHEFRINDKVLIRRDIGNPYLGKLAKPTQGPFKIIDVQQLPINGTILIQRSPTSVERVNIRRLLPFFERYN
jgi:transposase InsO family protein